MVDVVSAAVRSRMMAGIRGKDTKPEVAMRRGLHALGFRFRLHYKKLPGKPDILLPKYRAAIFVQGCFWHGHDCHLFRTPKTRSKFWQEKIEGNKQRDAIIDAKLRERGWRVGKVWECALKGRARMSFPLLIHRCANWLKSDEPTLEVTGCCDDLDAT